MCHYDKSVEKKRRFWKQVCPATVSRKSVQQECQARAVSQSGKKEFQKNVSRKTVKKECPARVSRKSVKYRFLGKSVKQECAFKSALQASGKSFLQNVKQERPQKQLLESIAIRLRKRFSTRGIWTHSIVKTKTSGTNGQNIYGRMPGEEKKLIEPSNLNAVTLCRAEYKETTAEMKIQKSFLFGEDSHCHHRAASGRALLKELS